MMDINTTMCSFWAVVAVLLFVGPIVIAIVKGIPRSSTRCPRCNRKVFLSDMLGRMVCSNCGAAGRSNMKCYHSLRIECKRCKCGVGYSLIRCPHCGTDLENLLKRR